MKLNAALIRQRRLARGWSRMELGRRLGRSQGVVRGLEDGSHDAGDFNLRFVARLADLLEVEPRALLMSSDSSTRTTEHRDGDAATLEAALHELGRVIHAEELAQALGWELTRVQAAGEALKERLLGTGARLFTQAGFSLRTADSALTQAQVHALHARRRLLYGLRRKEVSVMLKVIRGEANDEWEGSLALRDRNALASLQRHGLIESRHRAYRMTAAAAYSLGLVEHHAPPARRGG